MGQKRYVLSLVRLLITAAALYLVFRGEDLREIGGVLLELNLWIFAASLGLYVFSQVIFAVRWSLLLRVQSINIGLPVIIRLHFMGLFYNNCLPTSVGGDFLRAWYVTKHTDKKLQAALSVFVDRAVGLTGLLIMVFCSYWFVPADGRGQPWRSASLRFDALEGLWGYWWVPAALGAIVACIITAFVLSGAGRRILPASYTAVRRRSADLAAKVRQSIRIYWHKRLALAAALVLTFCCQGVFIVGLWLIGREIGLQARAKYYFIFFPISWLVGTLPISIGGLGVVEGWLKVAFSGVGNVTGQQALVLALCHRLFWLFGSLPGAAVYLLGGHLPKEFFIDYKRRVK